MENEKLITLRKLEARDIFPLSTILSKIGVKQLTELFKENGYFDQLNDKKNNNKTSLYIDMALSVGGLVLENLEKIETNLYKLLSSLTGLEQKEIGSLPPDKFLDLIVEVVKKEEFKDFFKAASRFVK